MALGFLNSTFVFAGLIAAIAVARVAGTGDMPAGSTKDLTVNLKAGHYALICNHPGHYSGGMHTDFTVS